MRKINKLKDLLIDYDYPNDWQYQQWKSNLPSNLKNTDTSIYDLYGAFKAGMQPELNNDGTYHLGSRDPNTGKILKKKNHPTYNKAIQADIEVGYYPIEYNGDTYTRAPIPMGDLSGWQIPEHKESSIHKYQNGGYTQEYYDEKRRKARWDTSVEQLKNLLSGFNKTFGTAAAGASLLTGGGWALNRLLRRNHPSTLGQKLAPMVLPANAADTAGDVSKMVENPSFENTLDLSSGLVLGRFKNLGNPIRQLAELISQGFNVDDILPNHSEGGIHIKKKNRGKFTETMKRTGKTAEELKHSKNPLTRKRANFVINSRKWAKKK